MVSRILRLKGFGVYDCDLRARILMETDDFLKKDILEIAGNEVYGADGKLNRRLLANIIFSDEVKRRKVNGAVHAAVMSDVEKWRTQSGHNIFVETAIPAESGLISISDAVWLVEAPEKVRIARVMARDGRSREETALIIETQRKEEQKIEKSGIRIERIENSQDSSLLSHIDTLLSEVWKLV